MAAGDSERALAERIRQRLLEELERAYEDAAMQGLCGEGALEYALGRVREFKAAALLDDTRAQTAGTDNGQSGD